MADNDGLKRCSACKQKLQATLKHFYFSWSNTDRLESRCKPCMCKAKRERLRAERLAHPQPHIVSREPYEPVRARPKICHQCCNLPTGERCPACLQVFHEHA